LSCESIRYRLDALPLFTHACHCRDCQARIWVKRRQRWLTLPAGVPCFDENYAVEAVWPAASLARLRAAEANAIR
jgi:hypothetical protein